MASDWRVSFEEFASNLTQIFERLRRTNQTLVVQDDDEAILVHRVEFDDDTDGHEFAPTSEDFDAFRASAGSWSDVDTDKLIDYIYARREHISDRPQVKL